MTFPDFAQRGPVLLMRLPLRHITPCWSTCRGRITHVGLSFWGRAVMIRVARDQITPRRRSALEHDGN